jgi:hypothetical protein
MHNTFEHSESGVHWIDDEDLGAISSNEVDRLHWLAPTSVEQGI